MDKKHEGDIGDGGESEGKAERGGAAPSRMATSPWPCLSILAAHVYEEQRLPILKVLLYLHSYHFVTLT